MRRYFQPAGLFLSLILLNPSIVFSRDSNLEVKEIYLASGYLDGGSYFYLIQTTDERNIYIYIDRSLKQRDESGNEIAYLNSIDLTKNTELYGDVLLAFDSYFRTRFDEQSPFDIDIESLLEAGDEDVLKALMLGNLIQDSCVDLISFHSAELTKNIIDCSFYIPEGFVLR